MRGQTQAIGIAAGFAILSLVFPLVGILSAAVVGLVTLRQGPAAGLLLVATSSVVAALVTMMLADMTFATPAILSLAILLLLTWLIGVILRYTRSLPVALSALTGIGMVIIVAFHLAVGDPLAWWQSHFDEFFAQATDSMMADQKMVFEQNLETWAAIMTGFVTMAFLLNIIFALFIARAWQATLYNPGGFRQEFYDLQFGKKYAIIALVVATLALIPDSIIAVICKDILMVILMVYVLQGIAVVHFVVAKKGLHWAWLVGLYVLVFLMSQLVAITGYIDTWMNFRKRISGQV